MAKKVKIEGFVHRCMIKEGPGKGNKSWHTVKSYDISLPCKHCGQPLATWDEITRHMYDQLTGSD